MPGRDTRDPRGGRDARAAGDAVDVVSRIYHTENAVAHAEGDAYAVDDRVLAETLRAIGFVSIEGWSELEPPAAPVLTTLTPDTAVVGGANFTLQVQGTGFAASDTVHWNSAPVATTFVSATELTTPIDLTTVTAGAIPVSVQTAGALGSNALSFTVTAARQADSRHDAGRPADERGRDERR